jgi:protein gp37
MSLKKATGNMYSWVTHTWNPVRGKCPHECQYCYVGKWKQEQKPLHLDQKELRANLGEGNSIFVCSGCDLFHLDVDNSWISAVLCQARQFLGNEYLWHTKNPLKAVRDFQIKEFPENSILCATIETNRWYDCMGKTKHPEQRAYALTMWQKRCMVTVEPILDFDVLEFSNLIFNAHPEQVNIGADSGGNKLPEPEPWKVKALIERLEPFTKVHLKKNLARLLKAT